MAEDRTWTSRRHAEALNGGGVELGPHQLRRHFKRIKAGDRRTASNLKYKQDPAQAHRAGRVLANLKAKVAAGLVVLDHLDECDLSTTLPVGCSWSLPGRRKFIRYEAPQGQRPGGLPALRAGAPAGDVHRRADAELARPDRCPQGVAVVEVPSRRGTGSRRLPYQLSKVIRTARKGLADPKIHLGFLPPYSPELNRIEPMLGFTNDARKLRSRSQKELRSAA